MIHYTISMPEPHSHLFHVVIDVDEVKTETLDLALPVWTPGSYMVRDYARHVQAFSAESDGWPLAWHKLDKTSWQVMTEGASRIRVRYAVYAYELTVRTSHLDGSHGYFNPATLCMYVPGRLRSIHLVTVQPPPHWRVSTGLRPVNADAVNNQQSAETPTRPRHNSFLAQDYDELVDSPFECGTHRLLTFEVDGIPHEIAIWGHGNESERRLVEDTRRIVETERDLFGALPYERYVFILHLANNVYGGLEHRNSVTNIIDRWTFQPPKSYERFLGLTSHEFYHVWNVKRIRPRPLGPFDYSRENYTRQLWVAEGITSYYDNLVLVRSGLISPERYLEVLADDILALQSQPGRALQSLAQSSFDAWIKLYRPDENSANSSISYYLKGSLVALLLDMEIRSRTQGERSLDDVMRWLFHEAYGGEHATISQSQGFDEAYGFLEAIEAVAGESGGAYRSFLERYVYGTDELDYAAALKQVGVQLHWDYKTSPADESMPTSLGLRLKTEHGRLKVAVALSDGPAAQAGVYAHDEIIALNGFRVSEEALKARLAERQPGDSVQLTLFRGDQLIEVPVILTKAPYDALKLLPPPEETHEAFLSWISGAASSE